MYDKSDKEFTESKVGSQVLTESQGDVYFARMHSSLGDKEKVLPFVKQGKVLDVGAGGGELSEVLRLAGNEVWALDGSSEAIARISEDFPLVHTVPAFSHEVGSMFPEKTFDTIVCSSILHEVYSYGDPRNGEYSVMAVLDALWNFYHLLKPGGVLIIRDGVMPTGWMKDTMMSLKNDDAVEFLEMYREKAPFYSSTPGIRKVNFVESGPRIYNGSLASVMEFLFTLTWGWDAAIRETQELYGVFTEEEYCRNLEMLGFTVEHSEQYLQPGYSEHLDPVADIFDCAVGEKMSLPSSNMILTARRP